MPFYREEYNDAHFVYGFCDGNVIQDDETQTGVFFTRVP
jgi:hypothetical protein